MSSRRSALTSATWEGRTVTSRRTALRVGWAVPAMVVATSAPAMAASRLQNRLRFTNVTATVGKQAGVIYANTKVAVIDGPDPVLDLTVTVHVTGCDPYVLHLGALDGWDATDILATEWAVNGRDECTVTFTAYATGVEPITANVTVAAPGWW